MTNRGGSTLSYNGCETGRCWCLSRMFLVLICVQLRGWLCGLIYVSLTLNSLIAFHVSSLTVVMWL